MEKGILDFTKNQTCMRNYLYAMFWTRIKPVGLMQEIYDKLTHTRRYRVPVSSPRRPRVGELLKYTSSNNQEIVVRIYGVSITNLVGSGHEYELLLLRDKKLDKKFNNEKT